jgi:hypothetical protein
MVIYIIKNNPFAFADQPASFVDNSAHLWKSN